MHTTKYRRIRKQSRDKNLHGTRRRRRRDEVFLLCVAAKSFSISFFYTPYKKVEKVTLHKGRHCTALSTALYFTTPSLYTTLHFTAQRSSIRAKVNKEICSFKIFCFFFYLRLISVILDSSLNLGFQSLFKGLTGVST